MQLYDQIRTAMGRYPTNDAHLVEDKDSKGSYNITFDFLSPQEFAALQAEVESEEKHRKILPNVSIEDLAVLPSPSTLANETASLDFSENRLLELARKCGPLFGEPVPEHSSDWTSASLMAYEIVSMQEVLNGIKQLGASKMIVDKIRVIAENTNSEFLIYAASFNLGTAGQSVYAESMPPLPWFKRFSEEDGFDYSFMQTSEEDGQIILTAYLLSFEQEISITDFATVMAYFYDDPSIAEEAAHTIAADQKNLLSNINDDQAISDALGIVLNEDNLLVESMELSKTDYPHLQKLVKALISLHLQDIRIDVIASTGSDEFMVFDSFLSYLWYTFANELDAVKIGYCERCGNGFSLTGHRGIQRRFCSEKCKTEAKNARMKKRSEEERRRFWEGESVRDIAKSNSRGKQKAGQAMDAVRMNLSKWKRLQHALDAALVTGKNAAGFVKRCNDEGVFSQNFIENRVQKIRSNQRIRRDAQRYAENSEILDVIIYREKED